MYSDADEGFNVINGIVSVKFLKEQNFKHFVGEKAVFNLSFKSN